MRTVHWNLAGWAFAGAWCLTFGASAPLADLVENEAAPAQAVAAARAAIAAGADVNAAQVDGMTALHWAVHRDDFALTKLLLAAGADVRVENRYGVTALSLACANGNTTMVEALLAAGSDPNTTLRGGETVLMTAARTGNVGPVKALFARGAAIDAKEQQGQTALMWAAAEGHVDVVTALLAAGADFRTPLPSGFTPMFFAVRAGKPEVVRVLLAAGIDVNEAMQPKRTGGKMPKKGTSPLHLATENGHFELGAALLEAGADPDDQRYGATPLHMLSWVRKPDRGDDGDPVPIGSGNLTSLQFARKLVEHGADVNARLERGSSGPGRLGRKGATPFLLAADTADLPLMKLLVELGANPRLGNADSSTPLMAAAGLGTRAPMEEAGTETEALAALHYMLELDGDVNAVDAHGETAMHGAAYASFPSIVRLLHARGAKIEIWNRKNARGWTPLLIAEGHRPGNFKPSFETLAAIKEAMLADGVTPPPPTPPVPRKGYEAN